MRLFRFKNSNWFVCLFLVLFAHGTQAQTTEMLATYKAKYPGQHIVFTKNVNKVTIKMVKDIPVVTHTTNWEHLILDKNGLLSLSDESIEFSSFETMGEIEAYSLIPYKNGSKKIVATDFQTRDAESEGSVFHDDAKETTFMYPNIVEGSLRVLNYDMTMTDYHFPFGFSFNGYIPIENSTFIIECDTAVHLFTKLFNTENTGIVYTENVVKNKRIHTWILANPTMMKQEDLAPTSRYYSPHILAQIDYFNTKKGRVNVIGSPKDLHDYYKDNVAEVVNEVPSGELKTIAESVTKDLTSELDKVKAIYYWVQDNIKYIAFEEGMGGYVPRQPSKVIGKRYGDCKDMASLIYSMLKSVNITSYLTWIGSRSLPYKYTEFASSYCDNHMIAVYKNGKDIYFLDATNSFQQYNIPTGFIQGKEALIHISADEYEIVEVPIPDASVTFMTDTATITIDGRNVIGHSKTVLGGYYRSILSMYLHEIQSKDLDKAVTSIDEKGNNSYIASNSKITNLEDRDQDMIIESDFKISNYATSFDKEVYVNLILEKDIIQLGEVKADRIAPIEIDNKSDDSYTVSLTVPAGYSVKYVPKNVDFTSDMIHYSVHYSQTGSTITMTLKLKLDFILLPATQFKAWNEFIALKKSSVNESIVLIKNN